MKAAAAAASGMPTPAELREAVDTIRAEKLPETADGREKYFASNLSTAEQLGLQSEPPVALLHLTLILFLTRFPDKILPAATCLYRAMRVYPQPVELMIALEQSFPPAVFKAVMEMMTLEVSPNPPPPATPKSSAASDSASATSSRDSARRSRKKSDTTRTSSGKSSPRGTGPPSETFSSYEWDKVTELDSSATPPTAL